MQEIRSSNPPVVTGICDPNKSQGRHHRGLLFYFYSKFPEVKHNKKGKLLVIRGVNNYNPLKFYTPALTRVSNSCPICVEKNSSGI